MRTETKIGLSAVSVICTVHRTAEPLLTTALESLLSQVDVEFELIVVIDDENPSRSLPSALRTRLARDPRVRIFDSGRVGRGKALNIGIGKARYPYIAIQDADDVSHPQRLSVEARILDETSALFALFTGVLLISETSANPHWNKVCEFETKIKQVNKILLWKNVVCHTSMLCRKSMLVDLGGYSERLTNQLDYDLYLRALHAGKPMAKLSAVLVGKRKHRGQFFAAAQGLKQIRSSFELQKQFLTRRFTLELALPLVWTHLQFLLRTARYFVGRVMGLFARLSNGL